MVAEPAGELPEIRKRRNEIEIGANLCLSYRFAPILYRYGLSTVYNLTLSKRLKIRHLLRIYKKQEGVLALLQNYFTMII